MTETDLLTVREKYQGCLIGLAVGDALGAPVEGFTREQIKSTYGILNDYYPSPEYKIGEWTDDTSMALAIAESYIRFGEMVIEDIAKRFVEWFRNDGRGIGILTKCVLELIDARTEPYEAARLVWEGSGKQQAGNGALMRCAPIALANIHDDEKLIDHTTCIGLITHADPRSTDSCVLYNLLLSDIISGIANPLEDYFSLIGDETVKRINEDLRFYKPDKLPNSGYVIDTLTIALWTFKYAASFEEAVTLAVNSGGDTDTNAAVAGALAGAKYGIRGIPSRLVNRLYERNKILKTADLLFDIFCSPGE